jgi:hypothetical protein
MTQSPDSDDNLKASAAAVCVATESVSDSNITFFVVIY